jgi:hypothetical protein
MSGFGIHEQYDAGVELWQAGKKWRETAFLHQLSTENGSLMLAKNHDDLWLQCLERTLGQPVGSTWERMSTLLRVMPAQEARKRLWNASYLWWMNMEGFRLRMLSKGLGQGHYLALGQEDAFEEFGRLLGVRSQQLMSLAEVIEKVDNNLIPVVEEEK